MQLRMFSTNVDKSVSFTGALEELGAFVQDGYVTFGVELSSNVETDAKSNVTDRVTQGVRPSQAGWPTLCGFQRVGFPDAEAVPWLPTFRQPWPTPTRSGIYHFVKYL